MRDVWLSLRKTLLQFNQQSSSGTIDLGTIMETISN
jgi:hypothetical protein